MHRSGQDDEEGSYDLQPLVPGPLLYSEALMAGGVKANASYR